MAPVPKELFPPFPFEASFSGYQWIEFVRAHDEFPIFAIVLYIGLVFYVPKYLDKPLKLKTSFALWNVLLSAFSICGALRTVPHLVSHLMNNGFEYTVCTPPQDWYVNGSSGLWVFLFIISKIPELVDTVFLVLQKKEVIFLHWFHHSTVLLYCWHAYIRCMANGLWFAAMNYTVHSLMYTYYFAMNIGLRRAAKRFAPLITTLQLLQMVVGMFVTGSTAAYYYSGHTCAVDPANIKLGMAMYAAYFFLFAVLFRNLYCSGGGRRGLKRDGEREICGVDLKEGDAAGFFHTSRLPHSKSQ
eukprot:TRINITY_DN97279_c0_g1_i1.p2 TRINITY_DN97279_c0_g1~~TRINITY_DN97279_c0_g1_i1.p2  ORF type:complete len:300 (+),score=88.92 TRINITY_DN97279_c0_g1_i1:41-940(+)